MAAVAVVVVAPAVAAVEVHREDRLEVQGEAAVAVEAVEAAAAAAAVVLLVHQGHLQLTMVVEQPGPVADPSQPTEVAAITEEVRRNPTRPVTSRPPASPPSLSVLV